MVDESWSMEHCFSQVADSVEKTRAELAKFNPTHTYSVINFNH